MRGPQIRRTLFVTALALLLVAVACGDDSSSSTTDTTDTTAATTTTQAPVPATTQATQASTTTLGTPAGLVCSASGLSPVSLDYAGLSDEANSVKRWIIESAVSCDYLMLEEIAFGLPESEFIYSFGGGDDFFQYLVDEEDFNTTPMWHLVTLLNLSAGTIPYETAGGPTMLHIFPAAASYDDWASVPQWARDEIAPIYGSEFTFYDAENAYFGPRVGITDQGEWVFFILGGD